MCIELEKAIELAKDHICAKYRNSLDIQASESPDPVPYGFDPDGWEWFTVIDNSPPAVGAGKYVAVHMETGDVRYFDKLGD